MRPRKNSRDAILDAAESVVKESGAAHLTLDAVCAKAGLSKGGLLYHFHTKEALMLAMLERLCDVLINARKVESVKLPASPARELKAYILAANFFRERRMQGIAVALLAAAAHEPNLVKPAQASRNKVLAELQSSGLSAAFTSIVALAIDGLWILELLGVSTPSEEERQAIIRELLRLVDEEERRSKL